MAIDLEAEAERLAALCNSDGTWNCPRPDFEQTCPNVYCDDVEPEHWLEILKREAEEKTTRMGEIEMTDNTSSGVLKLSGKEEFGTAYIQFFHQGESQLMLANNADDKVIIPYDLLPKSQQDCGMMVRVVDAVRHLVDTIRNLEAQRDWLVEELCVSAHCDFPSQIECKYRSERGYYCPERKEKFRCWVAHAEEAAKEAGK